MQSPTKQVLLRHQTWGGQTEPKKGGQALRNLHTSAKHMQVVFAPQLQYYLYVSPADLRKGFDGLCGLVECGFGLKPTGGAVFIFLNRSRNLIKLLHWQGDGFAIFHKRLERGTYELPVSKGAGVSVTHRQLQFMLEGVVLASVKHRTRYARQDVEKA